MPEIFSSHLDTEPKEHILSRHEAFTLLFHAFKFSQGKSTVEKLIYHWLHRTYPKYRLPEEGTVERQELKSSVEQMILRFLQSGKHASIDEDMAKKVSREEFETLASVLEGKDTTEFFGEESTRIATQKILQEIGENMIREDVVYIFLNVI